MLPGHLLELPLYAALLFLVRHVSTQPVQEQIPIDLYSRDTHSTCPFLAEVGQGHALARVTLKKSLVFDLKPNLPAMSMEFVGNNMMYKAIVSGSFIELIQCDVNGQNCDTVNAGGSKSKPYLMTNEWNKIHVNQSSGQVSVGINNNLMHSMKMMRSNGSSKGSGVGQVTFVVLPAKPSYHASLKIPCSDGLPEILTEHPILPSTTSTTISTLQPETPYKKCPLYQVEMNHPSAPAPLINNLTLAVYPSHPSLLLIIANEISYFKVQVYGPSVRLLECQVTGRKCVFKDEVHLLIEPETWNFVTVSLQDDKIFINIRVNEREEMLTTDVPSTFRRGLTVTAYAPEKLQSLNAWDYYVAFVNVKCEVIEQIEQTMTWQILFPTTTPTSLPTNAPIVENTTVTNTAPGFSRDLGIVVGVLVGVLLIIALAIIISTVVKKRRSAAITEQSPLQNQFQQQD